LQVDLSSLTAFSISFPKPLFPLPRPLFKIVSINTEIGTFYTEIGTFYTKIGTFTPKSEPFTPKSEAFARKMEQRNLLTVANMGDIRMTFSKTSQAIGFVYTSGAVSKRHGYAKTNLSFILVSYIP
jgi:hypothetical protein